MCGQGVVGTMPWVAMGFMTLYLQLLGFTDMHAALLVALFSLGGALGSFGGGYIGASTPAPLKLLCTPAPLAACIETCIRRYNSTEADRHCALESLLGALCWQILSM